ncbi:pentapeptide repeat-containing protein [Poritiphilus flavus]|uniref:Pentapeptide repeat-containing protein n=1 Tax=Poritiphilus flavus TaxID=2697053 RepID=A0A6L9E7H9_9FLAO|nr:pentapeptide repeat-containing protein [Poritiphilus flavus]NAS10591.1 hypothetical protein [Poritiphilus flavus]
MFQNIEFNNVDFDGVTFKNVNFNMVTFNECNFRGIPQGRLNFQNPLGNPAFENYFAFTPVLFEECRFTEVTFNNEFMFYTVFFNSTFDDSSFSSDPVFRDFANSFALNEGITDMITMPIHEEKKRLEVFEKNLDNSAKYLDSIFSKGTKEVKNEIVKLIGQIEEVYVNKTKIDGELVYFKTLNPLDEDYTSQLAKTYVKIKYEKIFLSDLMDYYDQKQKELDSLSPVRIPSSEQ